jgi:hypothetical protein
MVVVDYSFVYRTPEFFLGEFAFALIVVGREAV